MPDASSPLPLQHPARSILLGSVAVGLLLGLVAGVAEESARIGVEFFLGTLAFAPVYLLLFHYVLPRIEARSTWGSLAGQALAAVLAMTVASFVVMNLILLIEYQTWLFQRDSSGAFVARSAWVYFLTPIFPAALLAVTLFNQAWVPIRDLEARAQRADELATLARFQALRAQIDPHFLFNSLNSIAQLISTDPARAEECVQRLSEIFRYLLSSKDRAFVTLGDELEIADGYLDIERARFGDQLRVEFDVADRARSWIVPTLILQPLVENAVRHGISKKVGGGEICVRARIVGAELVLDVEDTGMGIDPNETPSGRSNGVGLRNVRERLTHAYGAAYDPSITSRPGEGTHIRLRVPRKTSDDRHRAAPD